MRLLPCGSQAILVDLDDKRERRVFDRALHVARQEGLLEQAVLEQVPAAHTVLVRLRVGFGPADVARHLRSLDLQETIDLGSVRDQPELVVPTFYDGPDLESLAEHLRTTTDALIRWHTESTWTVDFAGFAPGFGYLVRDQPSPAPFAAPMPRLERPRTRVPAGSVGLAGSYSGIYPSASAGGWQLIGRTNLPTWDVIRESPALLAPGRTVRFEVSP